MLSNVRSAVVGAWSAVRDRAKGVASSPLDTPASNKLRDYLDRINRSVARDVDSEAPADFRSDVDPGALNARARIGREPDGESWRSFIIIEICGTIQAPEDNVEVDLEVTLGDVTDKAASALPALNRPKQGPVDGSSHFSYSTAMGRLCHQTTVLEDWTAVARVSPDWFVLPRQGSRRLQYHVAVKSRQSRDCLASVRCTGTFENVEPGYLDIEDNMQRVKTLAVGLAFSVGAAHSELREAEVEVIHAWVRTNFGSANASSKARTELQRALQKTAAFFRKGGRLNVEDICREILSIAPLAGRLEMLDLCLRVVGAKGQVTTAELTLLKDLAEWLEIGMARLRGMVEKVLPVHMHQTQDAEMVLGVTDEMSREEMRRQLNHEYA
ncbi:MAG: hypothetical protein JW741_08305, partial [Sedimentisphaerales bacterium]|nr:hypothetical protein [Sedimentisphaerales bacterium]